MSDDDQSDSERLEEQVVDTRKTEETIASPTKTTTFAPVDNDANDWSCMKGKVQRPKVAKPITKASFPSKKSIVPPLAVEQLSPELTLEVYNFPASWRTSDIRKLLNAFEGQYRLKWQSDTSCWIHFEKPEQATSALEQIHEESASFRPFAPENVLLVTPKTELYPTSETTIEIYGFPSTWRAPELNKILTPLANRYRLKWRNEASCYVIFENAEVRIEAQTLLDAENVIKTRPYTEVHLH